MTNEIDDEFQKICESYKNNLPKKIKEIKASFDNLFLKWDTNNFLDFSSLIHKLNGSAGIYGYLEISNISAKIEKIMSRYDYNIPAEKNTLEEIKKLLSTLESQITSQINNPEIYKIKKINMDTLYLLNLNNDYSFGEVWANALVEQLSAYGYKLSVFSDINLFISALIETNPLAIIVSLDLVLNPFDVDLDDPSIENALKSHFKNHYTIFISKNGDIDKRLKAFRMEGKNFLLLPFDTSELSSELNNLKKLWTEKIKVLMVDDDKEILNHHSHLLSNAGIENIGISSYKEIDKILHSFNPDLLLFDLNMGNCSGMELAAVVRQQKAYEYIPIIYLSTEENKNIQLQALNVGGDDFITKASDPNVIVQTIRTRANRYRKIRTMTAKDSLTGAFIFDYIAKEINKYTQQYKDFDYPLTLAILRINNLEEINNLYGYSATDQLLVTLFVYLSSNLDFSRIIGRYTDNQFIVIFPNTTNEKAKEELAALQNKFRSLLHYADGKAYGSSFSFGLATYKKDNNIQSFINDAAKNINS